MGSSRKSSRRTKGRKSLAAEKFRVGAHITFDGEVKIYICLEVRAIDERTAVLKFGVLLRERTVGEIHVEEDASLTVEKVV